MDVGVRLWVTVFEHTDVGKVIVVKHHEVRLLARVCTEVAVVNHTAAAIDVKKEVGCDDYFLAWRNVRVDEANGRHVPALVMTLGDNDKHVFKSTNHHDNWLNCIKTREKPICDVEIGARSVTVCHLINLAYWHRRKLKWDPQKWEFPGDAEANGWRSRPRREKYELPAI